MRFRTLGDTGLTVSEIGFGTIPILSGDIPVLPDYHSPNVDTAVSIMKSAYDMGCNLFDTAAYDEYGDAEYKLGVFAASVKRDTIILSDKARRYDYDGMRAAVFSSCERLGTHPDIYFVHQADDRNADHVFSPGGALDALYQLKKEGVIRFTGIASHYYSVLERAVNDPRTDVIQMSGNVLECGMLKRMSANPAFMKKGILVNKVYAAGLLTDEFSPSELIGGILGYPVSSALIGIGTQEEAKAAMGRTHFPYDIPFEEAFGLLSRRHDLIACDRCQKCVCSYRHEIHSVLRYFNYMKLGKEEWAKEKLGMFIHKILRRCEKCSDKTCLDSCPRMLPIPDLMKMIGTELKNSSGRE